MSLPNADFGRHRDVHRYVEGEDSAHIQMKRGPPSDHTRVSFRKLHVGPSCDPRDKVLDGDSLLGDRPIECFHVFESCLKLHGEADVDADVGVEWR